MCSVVCRKSRAVGSQKIYAPTADSDSEFVYNHEHVVAPLITTDSYAFMVNLKACNPVPHREQQVILCHFPLPNHIFHTGKIAATNSVRDTDILFIKFAISITSMESQIPKFSLRGFHIFCFDLHGSLMLRTGMFHQKLGNFQVLNVSPANVFQC